MPDDSAGTIDYDGHRWSCRCGLCNYTTEPHPILDRATDALARHLVTTHVDNSAVFG